MDEETEVKEPPQMRRLEKETKFLLDDLKVTFDIWSSNRWCWAFWRLGRNATLWKYAHQWKTLLPALMIPFYSPSIFFHLRLGKLVDVERLMGFISCSASSWLSWQLFFFNLIFWPHCAVFGVLAPCSGFNPMLLPGEAQSLNYWTTREVCPLGQVRQRSTHSHRLRSYQSSAPTALEW